MPNKFKLNPTGNEANSLFRNNWAIDTTANNIGGGPSSSTGVYNGAAVPTNGYVVYTPGGTAFTAANDTQLIEFTASFSGSTADRDNSLQWLLNNNFLVVDRDIKPRITEGLIVDLDGTNTASFDGNDWYDLSGSGNNAMLAGGNIVKGEVGLLFDGSSWFQINKSASMDAWANQQTVAIWMKHNFTSGRRNPWDQAYGGYGTWTHESGNNINCYFGDAGSNTSPYTSANSGTTPRDQWNFMVTSRDNTTLRWYNNGALAGTRSHGYGSLTTTTAAVRIGRGYAGIWIGEMAHVMAWNRALTQDEITSLMEATRPD
jgi:hypothetical protein